MRAWLLLVPLLAAGQEVPAGAEILVRLTKPLSTQTARPGDPVEAVAIAPVIQDGLTVIAAGTRIRGSVEMATPAAPDHRAVLLLSFGEAEGGGIRRAFTARVAEVDNARETVDEQGSIVGILASDTLTGQLDSELGTIKGQYGGLASILSAAKGAMFDQASPEIVYPAGVELTLRLTQPLVTAGTRTAEPPAWPAGERKKLDRIVSKQPIRATARENRKASDLVNLLFVASQDSLRRAFRDAGWSEAAGLSASSQVEVLRALAEDRGYQEAPVSVLWLDGKPPDLVFEKANNTFARRHHVRIWRVRGSAGGTPLWAAAATHDTGVDFSEAGHTFLHRIDPMIDREREKIVNDLLFAGRVTSLELLERPKAPRKTLNATGDPIETDARIAVVGIE